MALSDFWKKEEYLEKYGIRYQSYSNYVAKRTILYARPGRQPGTTTKKAKKTSTSADEKAGGRLNKKYSGSTPHPMDRYWNSYGPIGDFAGGQILRELHENDEKTREEESYRRMQCNFQNPTKAEALEVWWEEGGLESYRYLTGASAEWLEEEMQLMRECKETFGPHAVHYQGPKLPKDRACMLHREISDKGSAATTRRRARTRKAIRRYRLVQARHALAMQKSGKAVTVSLLVTLDFLIEQYDKALQAEGLAPSDLRLRLWESNYNRQRKLATERDNKAKQWRKRETESPILGDTGFSAEERGAFCRDMTSKIVEEEMLLESLSEESPEREWETSESDSDCCCNSDVSTVGSTQSTSVTSSCVLKSVVVDCLSTTFEHCLSQLVQTAGR